jgi:hypothetical protein
MWKLIHVAYISYEKTGIFVIKKAKTLKFNPNLGL